jgi:hypothetical protein
LINPLEVIGDLFMHFPTDIVQAVAHQMDNAQLHGSLRINGFDGFGEAFQAIDTGDGNVLHAAIFQFGDYL